VKKACVTFEPIAKTSISSTPGFSVGVNDGFGLLNYERGNGLRNSNKAKEPVFKGACRPLLGLVVFDEKAGRSQVGSVVFRWIR
jgi:hypothetical protein